MKKLIYFFILCLILSDEEAEVQFKMLTDVNFGKEWVVKQMLTSVYNLTGEEATDFKSVMLLGTTPLTIRDLLKKRDPSSF